MDEILRGAVQYFLDEIDQVVPDLLVIEIDWGELTPVASNESVEFRFVACNLEFMNCYDWMCQVKHFEERLPARLLDIIPL